MNTESVKHQPGADSDVMYAREAAEHLAAKFGHETTLKVRALDLNATPRVSDDHSMVTLSDVRRFGKWKVYGNATQYTVAELTSGAVVYVRQDEQSKAVVTMLRKRLKGVYGNTGNGTHSTADAFGWEAR